MIGEDGVRRIDGKEVVLASNMTNTGIQKSDVLLNKLVNKKYSCPWI